MGLQKYRADKAGPKQDNGGIPWFCHWIGGPTLSLIRNCPVVNREGISARTVYITGEPDTWFSIPAACSYRGETIRGFVTCDDNREYVFHAYNVGTEDAKEKAMNTIPNFDAMTQSDLMAFWKRYSRASRKDAEALIGDRRKGFTGIAATLANYACNKAVAMGCREKGEIQAATCYEQALDLCYDRLPADLKW